MPPSGSGSPHGRLTVEQEEARGLRLLSKALTIRRTEERLLDLFARGELSGTIHTCIGQEWVGVAVAEALRPGDVLFSNHRCHGHYLAWTDDVEGLVAELMGRATGVCGGRGGSQHLCRDGFFSNGIQGGIMPVAAGMAMAACERGSGSSPDAAPRVDGVAPIAVVFIGDGTLGEGVLYETLNIAAVWSLPVLIVLEDNGIAQSTDQRETLAGTIRDRAWAFGIEYREADTWHPEYLVALAEDAVDRVRRTRCPLVLHVHTYRLRAHSKGDDDRDRQVVGEYVRRDPLNRILREDGEALVPLVGAIDRRLDEAVRRAAAAPFACIPEFDVDCLPNRCRAGPPCSTGTGDPPVPHAPESTAVPIWSPPGFAPTRVVDAIRDALAEAMEADERVILLGEDLRDPYGGAFKVTAGLSTRFGDRVRNTPISEAAIVGIGTGLAMAGRRPVVEIMFGDFLMLAADQIINHAAKFAWMYNDQVSVPLVIRTPMGGYRGYGPTHSQSLEKHLLGLPGTRVLALHARCCPGELYRTLLARNDRPTLVIENKLLYGQRTRPEPPPGWSLEATADAFPTVRLMRGDEPMLTVVAFGGMAETAEAAVELLAEEEDVACELLLPTQLYPLETAPLVESVRRTGRLLVIEEGQGFAGWGAEVIARVAAAPGCAGARTGRAHAAACPIPASRPAEFSVLPSVDGIVSAAVSLITA